MGGIVAVVGLACSMLTIRLMMVVENAQVIAGAVGQQLQKRPNMGARKFRALKAGIAFFGKISSLIFVVQDMYLEKTVQAAALTMMNTVLSSNKIVSQAIKKRVTRR